MGTDLVTKNELATFLKVHRDTIAKWEKEKKITAEPKEQGKLKRYSLHKVLVALGKEELEKHTIIYSNEMSFSSKDALESHVLLAKQFCTANGWRYMVIIDESLKNPSNENIAIGNLVEFITLQKVARIILPTRNSVEYFEYRIIEALCKQNNIQLLPIESQPNTCAELIKHAVQTIKHLCKNNPDILKKVIDELS